MDRKGQDTQSSLIPYDTSRERVFIYLYSVSSIAFTVIYLLKAVTNHIGQNTHIIPCIDHSSSNS